MGLYKKNMTDSEKIKDQAVRVADYVVMIINYETPKLLINSKYANQEVLEEVIKELNRRV